ncbi:MAG: SDR family NAD(P)-dependent oxidoreductase [Candidatus Caenarcaniphilales bacterium]|nr:SDR family NAD(P)-dependent oxidoreductase [Candidatus Caenarcaniphilales bacterium]
MNNAAVLKQGDFLSVGSDEFLESLKVNFEAPFHLMRALVPEMVKNNYGRVVNLSSGWGAFADGLTGPAAYSVTKAAINALTLSLSQAITATNVKVNSMCPGWVRTRMGGEGASRSPEEGAETVIWLATLEDDGPSGGFFRDKKLIDW